jgi:polar amino acid transport system permease protein
VTCWETINAYAFRSIGFGERQLPSTDFTLCHQFTLIGSGMIWNIYFGLISLLTGFFLATMLALGKGSDNRFIRKPSEWFIFVFRGSPLFIQFFFGYFLFLTLKNADGGVLLWVLFRILPDQFVLSSLEPPIRSFFTGTFRAAIEPFTSAWLGAAVVLFLNTSAYSAEIFYGALQAIPRGDVDAADAYGLAGWKRFRRIIWPTSLRLAWPAYTNEAIFLFHSTTLVFFSGFPASQQMGDALYYASYFADKTFNPFIPYPILAMYFILMTLTIIGIFGIVNLRLNRHLPNDRRSRMKFRMQVIR